MSIYFNSIVQCDITSLCHFQQSNRPSGWTKEQRVRLLFVFRQFVKTRLIWDAEAVTQRVDRSSRVLRDQRSRETPSYRSVTPRQPRCQSRRRRLCCCEGKLCVSCIFFRTRWRSPRAYGTIKLNAGLQIWRESGSASTGASPWETTMPVSPPPPPVENTQSSVAFIAPVLFFVPLQRAGHPFLLTFPPFVPQQ